MLRLDFVPCNRNSSFMKMLMKTRSRSETMVDGKLCSLTISLINTSATLSAVYGCFNPIKCLYLDNRSTTTSTESIPSTSVNLPQNPWICLPTSSLELVGVAATFPVPPYSAASVIVANILPDLTSHTHPETVKGEAIVGFGFSLIASSGCIVIFKKKGQFKF